MKKFLIAGIDPGTTSGLAIIKNDMVIQECIQGSPDMIWNILLEHKIKLVAIEKATSRPKQGVVSTCTFCKSFGYWLGILDALRLGYVIVSPLRWKRVLDSGKRDKRHVIEFVDRMFNIKLKLKEHHKAEAIVIAYWGLKYFLKEF